MSNKTKWMKRCVIVVGIATTGLIASTYAQKERQHSLYELVLQSLDIKASRDVPKDFLTTKQIVASNGFGYEQHILKTEDGYILRAHRILTDTPGGPPIMFQHGFLAASDSLLSLNRKNSLAFMLADAGFDVWLTDQRGNWYSREHLRYPTNESKFWDFSFHESGYYDLPAFIDYILEVTKQSQLFYVGHSMGTTVFFVMASLRPEYNKKIKAAALMAPVAITPTLEELTSNGLKLVFSQADILYRTFKTAGVCEFFPRTRHNIVSMRKLCGPSATQDLCLDFVGMGYGDNRENLDRLLIGDQLSYLPAGSSLKTAHHLTQIFRYGFQFYDYGELGNFRKYGSDKPPLYPLKHISAPIALYWGSNDPLYNRRSIGVLASQLQNVIVNYEVPDPKFTHVDFVFGMNTAEILNNEIIYLFESLS